MLKFFDCNSAIGRWKRPRFGAYETADELERVLDYLQVERALVYHAFALEGHPTLGNAMLMQELAGRPRLLPSWVLIPHHTGEMPAPDFLVDNLLSQGVRFVRLFPGTAGHGFSLEPWCIDPLFEKLAEHRIPALIDFMLFRRDDPDWGLIHTLCQRYPTLPIILAGQGIGRASRSFYSLLQVCPNLYIELSKYTPFRGIEAICQRVDAKRLLYGSGLPQVAPGVSMTSITHASVSDEEKMLIASGNLERLLAEVIA